jgi:hypothetical protein
MSLLSYTSKTKTDCVKKTVEALKSKRLNGMTALSKFLVLLAIFLLANLGDAFINLSSTAGNLVWVNHWI